MKQTLFITGTDTGVGKTVLTALLTRFLRGRGVPAAALKPVCAGGRGDARALQAAARRENRRVTRPQVVARIRPLQKRFDVVLVEGAGGLLSPLGENFNARDLIAALRATP